MIRKLCATLLLVLVLSPASALAQEATLSIKTVTNTRDDLLLFLSVKGAFTEEMETAIESGVPATFTFFVSLNRVRSLWMDQSVTDLELTHKIRFDTLKKEYLVTRSWDGAEQRVVKSLAEAKHLMTEIDSLRIAPLNRLEKGYRYQIRAKAELGKITLPFYLHYVLFFVSLWDFETDWHTVDFIY